jgi:hypothetical protein
MGNIHRVPRDIFDDHARQLAELRAAVDEIRNNKNPTIPQYDSTNWPPDATYGQLAADDNDVSSLWIYGQDDQWHKIGGSGGLSPAVIQLSYFQLVANNTPYNNVDWGALGYNDGGASVHANIIANDHDSRTFTTLDPTVPYTGDVFSYNFGVSSRVQALGPGFFLLQGAAWLTDVPGLPPIGFPPPFYAGIEIEHSFDGAPIREWRLMDDAITGTFVVRAAVNNFTPDSVFFSNWLRVRHQIGFTAPVYLEFSITKYSDLDTIGLQPTGL